LTWYFVIMMLYVFVVAYRPGPTWLVYVHDISQWVILLNAYCALRHTSWLWRGLSTRKRSKRYTKPEYIRKLNIGLVHLKNYRCRLTLVHLRSNIIQGRGHACIFILHTTCEEQWQGLYRIDVDVIIGICHRGNHAD
jgi:hypothetical protein